MAACRGETPTQSYPVNMASLDTKPNIKYAYAKISRKSSTNQRSSSVFPWNGGWDIQITEEIQYMQWCSDKKIELPWRRKKPQISHRGEQEQCPHERLALAISKMQNWVYGFE